ncbi:MAG: DUF3795 domain-containing protein [Smithellaceae bacterium]|nr:DUF3795 domain-containing protein [Smithellaceae bacterium]
MGKNALAAPCGLYCGVCGIYIAHRDNNQAFKEKLCGVYGVGVEELHCKGCLSDDVFFYCRSCPIKSCTIEKGYAGCHECTEFPCDKVEAFPLPVGKKVIMRSIPAWRELGTEKWMAEEDKRYNCPHCGYPQFRGAKRCRSCREPVDLD